MQFDVRALDRSTGVVSLVLEAVSAQAATAQAQQQGLAVLRVRPKGKAGWSLSRGGSNQAFPLGQFSHELLTLLEAGLSVVESVETLREKETKPLETLGIPAVNFLVLPRLLALGVMMPLLALYSNALGILGGMAVSKGLLSISPTAYWVEMQTIVSLSDIAVGVIKAVSFGLIVGLAGCLRGLQAERSAAGVGRAATSAVVTAILFIIVADAVFAVLFNIVGL